MGDNEVYQKCLDWGSLSKHDNGCTCYHQGFPIVASGMYHKGGATTREYSACDIDECYAFCTELYQEDKQRDYCKDGCNKYLSLGGCKGNSGNL